MVQGLYLSTLTAFCYGGLCGSMPSWRKQFKLMSKTPISSGVERCGIWHLGCQSLFVRGKTDVVRQRNVRVEAGWLFKGGDQGSNASSERSESANEDILIFFFQLDLATRVQYAWNTEQYDVAQQLRNKLTEKAIESENYAVAAKRRDAISKLEAESLDASAKALAHENANYSFRLGQRVSHKIFGYRAVVCGMDPVCSESSSWMETAQVEKPTHGSISHFISF